MITEGRVYPGRVAFARIQKIKWIDSSFSYIKKLPQENHKVYVEKRKIEKGEDSMARVVGIGHQDFGQLIQANYFYIDKTEFFRQWWENGDATFRRKEVLIG